MASTANERYDLMELIMVCLGRPDEAKKGTELHQLLATVFSDELTPEEKIDKMKNEYNIVTTVELEGGLAKMCNLSEYIEEKGIQKGIQQGIEQGYLKALFSLVQDGLLETETAVERSNLSMEIFQTLYREYQMECQN